jgi:CheY-like chemotaxis protein
MSTLNQPSARPLSTLLLIDDDMVSREVTAALLALSGYSVQTAEDGAAAIQLLESGQAVPGLILMDAQMPGLAGTHLIRELRVRSRAKVFVISASSVSAELLAAADAFLLKPFDAEQLRKLYEDIESRNPSAICHAPSITPSLNSLKPVDVTDDPVISQTTLAQLRELMSDAAVKQIYTAMVDDLFTRLTALDDAAAKGNAAEIRRIGHSIKGGCAMAGAMQASKLGARIEAAASETEIYGAGSDHPDNIAPLLSDLRAAVLNLARILEADFPA